MFKIGQVLWQRHSKEFNKILFLYYHRNFQKSIKYTKGWIENNGGFYYENMNL